MLNSLSVINMFKISQIRLFDIHEFLGTVSILIPMDFSLNSQLHSPLHIKKQTSYLPSKEHHNHYKKVVILVQ